MKIQIVWRASYPRYIGIGDTLETVTEKGIAGFKTWEEVEKFLTDMAVDYGEQGGGFHFLFGWVSEDGKLNKDAEFFSDKQIHERLRFIEDEK